MIPTYSDTVPYDIYVHTQIHSYSTTTYSLVGVAGLGVDLVDWSSTGCSVDMLSEAIEASSITSNLKGLDGL